MDGYRKLLDAMKLIYFVPSIKGRQRLHDE
jgi:hypothetical protein